MPLQKHVSFNFRICYTGRQVCEILSSIFWAPNASKLTGPDVPTLSTNATGVLPGSVVQAHTYVYSSDEDRGH